MSQFSLLTSPSPTHVTLSDEFESVPHHQHDHKDDDHHPHSYVPVNDGTTAVHRTHTHITNVDVTPSSSSTLARSPSPSPGTGADVSTSLLLSPPTSIPITSTAYARQEDEDEPVISEGKRIVPATASIPGSVFNLGNTIVGVGILSIPAAFEAFGLLLGPFMLALTGAGTAFSLHLLTVCAMRMGHPTPNFFLLSKATFPLARYLVDLSIAAKSVGVSATYLIVVGQLMVPAVIGTQDKETLSSWIIDRRLYISLAMLITIPLSCLKRMTHMRFTSFLSVLTCLYLILVLIYELASGSAPTTRPDKVLNYFTFRVTSITSIPTMIFAFTCAQNIFTIYTELKMKSLKNMNRIIHSTIISVFGLYLLVGLLGYISFGQHTTDDFLVDYTNNTTLINICRICMALHVCTCYPLSCHPFRVCITSTLYELFPTLRAIRNEKRDRIMHVGITTFFIVTTYTIAMTTNSLSLLFKIIGSTASTLITFILPGIFYIRITAPDDAPYHYKRLAAGAMTLLGCIILILSMTIIVLQQTTTVFDTAASSE